ILAGETKIVATSQADPSLRDTLTVTVTPSVDVSGIIISPKTMTLYVGGEKDTVSAKINPSTAALSIVFTSSDPGLASVSNSGVVTGLNPGQVTIIASPVGFPALTDS